MGIHPRCVIVICCMQSHLNDVLEGLLTCVVSVLLYFVISDFPEEAKWLSAEEKAFVKLRLQEDVGDSNHNAKVNFNSVLNVLKDCK